MDGDNNKVVLGLSGGVDSAVAAALLRRDGYTVSGLYLDNGFPGAAAATEAAASLGIPLRILDVREAMESAVCAPFAASYLRGETPNPCVLCNPAVKFRSLLDEAQRQGAAWIATGHYAVCRDGGLYRGRPENDQSYMLCRLERNQVARLLLPLGPYCKREVRALAAEMGLPVAKKPDSMEICFIPDGDYAGWIEARGQTPPPGNFILDGVPAGQHRGIHHYTIGQRRHLGESFGRPVYVSRICPKDNAVVLSAGDEVWQDKIAVREPRWLIDPPTAPFPCTLRLRHARQDSSAAVAEPIGDQVLVTFSAPVRAPAPGQAAAFYDGDRLLGGGFIGSFS